MATLVLFWTSFASWMVSASGSDDIFVEGKRKNLCKRLEEVHSGNVPLADGLRGTTLDVATQFYDEKFLTINAESGEKTGLEDDMLEALAKLAGFTVNYTIVPKPSEMNMSWSAALKQYALHHDMVTYSWWRITSGRERNGITSPYGFLDLGHAFVQLRPENKKTPIGDRVFQFLNPFKLEVWTGLFVAMLITAVMYWQVECGNSDDFHADDHGHDGIWGLCHSIYIIFNQLTDGGGGLNPQTPIGKALRVSWGWCVLLTIAAYTANLASFLMSQEQPARPFESVEQAIASQVPICLTCGATCPNPSTGARLFLDDFPNYKNIHMTKDVFDGLSTGACKVALSHTHQVRKMKGDLEYGDRCKIMNVGLPYRPSSGGISGGWMIHLDYMTPCSVLIRDVLRLHFVDLDADGTLEKLISRSLYNSQGPQCPVEDSGDQNTIENSRLDLVSMAGIFGLHAIVLALVMALLIMRRFCMNSCCVRIFLTAGAPVVRNYFKEYLDSMQGQLQGGQLEQMQKDNQEELVGEIVRDVIRRSRISEGAFPPNGQNGARTSIHSQFEQNGTRTSIHSQIDDPLDQRDGIESSTYKSKDLKHFMGPFEQSL